MKTSLVIATLGIKDELEQLLTSFSNQSYNISDIEVIIVDQNEKNFLNSTLKKFKNLNVIYIHSDIKGLSFNRNIGLKKATGDIICFPDDDCLYYIDTLSSVVKFFEANQSCDVALGRIYDRVDNINIIKTWPVQEKSIFTFNVYFMSSSITIFIRASVLISFDETLGVGARFGSCEDPDLLYRLLTQGKRIVYTPSIDVWHPTPDESNISLFKVSSYASGFGAFIRKDFDFVKLYLLLGCIIKKCLQFLFMNKKFKKGYFKAFFTGLYKGITQF